MQPRRRAPAANSHYQDDFNSKCSVTSCGSVTYLHCSYCKPLDVVKRFCGTYFVDLAALHYKPDLFKLQILFSLCHQARGSEKSYDLIMMFP